MVTGNYIYVVIIVDTVNMNIIDTVNNYSGTTHVVIIIHDNDTDILNPRCIR